MLKVAIALTPVAAKAVQNANTAGGLGTSTGWSRGVFPTISTSYTGYNPNDGKFYMNDLAVGYVPLAGAWVFGKVASRVLRI